MPVPIGTRIEARSRAPALQIQELRFDIPLRDLTCAGAYFCKQSHSLRERAHRFHTFRASFELYVQVGFDRSSVAIVSELPVYASSVAKLL